MDTKYIIQQDEYRYVIFEWEEEGCKHEWREYQGLIETYNYCVKCDQKESN